MFIITPLTGFFYPLSFFLRHPYRLLCVVFYTYIVNDKKRVYIVDDDLGIREILTSMLEDNYEVSAFEKGSHAITYMKHNNPSMLLLDYFLPGENTENIVAEVKQIKEKLPIVLMSANLTLSASADKIGVDEFMSKPFSRDTLIQVVEKYIH